MSDERDARTGEGGARHFGVDDARAIAVATHEGQADKAGAPYIGHVERVAAAVVAHGPDAVMAALLHDVVEDGELGLWELRAMGVPPQVLSAVDALTKRTGEPYLDAVGRAADHPLGRLVKLADNADNAAEERLAVLDPMVAERLRRKYEQARAVLTTTTGTNDAST